MVLQQQFAWFVLLLLLLSCNCGCRVTEEGIQSLSRLSKLCSLSYGYTSMPEADDVVAAIARQFTGLTGVNRVVGALP